jgi:endonuclease-8
MAETLFLRGVDPSRAVGSVEDLPALAEMGHRLLDANKEGQGRLAGQERVPAFLGFRQS